MGGFSLDPTMIQIQTYLNSVTWSCSLVWFLVMLLVVSHARACEASGNITRWEALEGVASRIQLPDHAIREKEIYAYYLWDLYKSSTRLERPKVAYEIGESLKKISNRDNRLDMIAVILFGAEKGRSILRARDNPHVGEDYYQCLQNTAESYRKHCGPINFNGLRHTRSFSNMCRYVKEKARIEDAIIIVCGLNSAPTVMDVEKPKIDISPTPIHGSSAYCGRVSINGVSRLKLQSYAKSYQVMIEPSVLIPHKLHQKIHICFHRNASRGLCECEKDEWRYIQKGSRESFMSPYEQRFIDVKFSVGVYGYVTITLDEVPLQLLLYVMLAGGVCLLFMAGFEDVLNENAADGWIAKWAMRVVGVICILQSSLDTTLAMVALASCFTLVYVITSITCRTIYQKKRLLAWKNLRDSWIKDDSLDVDDFVVAEWASVTRFREWVINNHHRIILLPDTCEDGHANGFTST